MHLLTPTLLVFYYSGWCPREGVYFPPLDEPVGRYPTISTTPRRTINPQRGGNGRDPHSETPPLKGGGKGVIQLG